MPDITSIITIQAGTANTIAGDKSNFRLFYIASPIGNLTLQNLTITRGKIIGGEAFGGAIVVKGSLSLSSVTFTDNQLENPSGGGRGSAIYNEGDIPYIAGSYFGNNTTLGGSTSSGEPSYGPLVNQLTIGTISDTTFDSNFVYGADGSDAGDAIGGGIVNGPVANINIITRTTFSNNYLEGGSGSGYAGSAGGGGIYSGGTIGSITNSTFSGNQLRSGTGTTSGSVSGGALVVGNLTVTEFTNNTIAFNSSITYVSGGVMRGGGLLVYSQIGNLRSNLMSNNIMRNIPSSTIYNNDCENYSGTITASSYNYTQYSQCNLTGAGDMNGILTDPELMPLANNGGSTMTHRLAFTSPAIDKGSCGNGAITTDQRLVARPFDNPYHTNAIDGCDIGAYELDELPPAPTDTFTPSNTPTNIPSDTPIVSITPSHTFTLSPTSNSCTKVATAPNLLLPSHRSHTIDTTPTFSWTVVANAQSYRLMVYLEDRSFVYKKRVFDTTYTLTNAEALMPAKYLWRVRTQDITCKTWTTWSKRYTLFVD